MLNISGLVAGYKKEEILHGVDLCASPGTITAVIGPNGCGKSTLLRSVVGMATVFDGAISFQNSSLRGITPKERAKRVAYLAQGRSVPSITVEALVLHGRFAHLSYPRKYKKEDLLLARTAMERMDICHLADRPLSTLSGGMRQKVYIAMALCQGAQLILLDEPGTYLDVAHQLKLDKILRSLCDEGKTVVCVSHDLLGALKSADRVAVMDGGRILMTDTPETILESGLIPKVFSVDVKSFTDGGTTGLYYSEGGTL